MGEMVIFKCNCGYEETFLEGVGMLFFEYPKKIFSKIKNGDYEIQGISKNDIKSPEEIDISLEDKKHKLGYRCYVCRKCKTITNPIHFSIKKADGQIKYPIERCEKCKTKLKRISLLEVFEQECPKCGKKTPLEEQELSYGCFD